MPTFQDTANFIWQVADDILRGNFKNYEYGDVVLPFVVLRRLDCVLEPTKDAVISQYEQFKELLDESQLVPLLRQAAGNRPFYNTSRFDLRRLAQDAPNIEANFANYLSGYSPNVRDIVENFRLERTVSKLARNNLLFMLVDKFTEIDLHPDVVPNHEMGNIYEELLRRFSEMSNETAGDHYTPREVIRLMVNLMFAEHADELQGKGLIRSVYDPAGGTGGMVIVAKEHIQRTINADVQIEMYAQELNEQTYAIAKSDVLIMGENADNIRHGNSFTQDGFKGQTFDYMFSNPPFGVSWKKEQRFIKNEARDPNGRFAAGLPRVSNGSLLFLQHMLSKMQARGSRIAIVFNGSPLFTGDAGSGESDIRKWIIENDWLEAIVALPTDLFYNTGIATYIWLLTNRKPAQRRGKVQLIDATAQWVPMRKSLGSKRKQISDDQIAAITAEYAAFAESATCKIFDNADFGYTKVRVEQPLRHTAGTSTGTGLMHQTHTDGIVRDKKGQPKADTKLRDYEKIPLTDDIDAYFEREVLPHVPDAWLDRSQDKVGYEINFTRYFYTYTPLRPLEEIKADILALEAETEGLLAEILA
ncbi:MAG: type I restriction-modification system subunit M [Anaerolineae bacterium]|nr:type I restriction-modification system subunit M [Anaerolineae bacterium]